MPHFARLNPSALFISQQIFSTNKFQNRVRVRMGEERGLSDYVFRFARWLNWRGSYHHFYILLSYHFHLLYFLPNNFTRNCNYFFLLKFTNVKIRSNLFHFINNFINDIEKRREKKGWGWKSDKSVKLWNRISQTFMNRDPLFQRRIIFHDPLSCMHFKRNRSLKKYRFVI